MAEEAATTTTQTAPATLAPPAAESAPPDRFAQALAAFNAAKAAESGGPEPAATEPATETPKPATESAPKVDVPTTAGQVQAAPDVENIDTKIDKKFEQLTRNLTKAESEKQAIEQRAKKAEQELAEIKADLEASFDEPERWIKRAKWDADKIKAWVESGGDKKVLNPETIRLAKQHDALEQKLKTLEEQVAKREAQQSLDNFKYSIQQEIKGAADKYQYFFDAFEGDLSQITDAIFGTMHAAYQQESKQLSVDEIAQTANQHWERLAKRLGSRTRSETADSKATTPASKQQPANAKPSSKVSSIEDAEPLTPEQKRKAEALAAYQAVLRETKSA